MNSVKTKKRYKKTAIHETTVKIYYILLDRLIKKASNHYGRFILFICYVREYKLDYSEQIKIWKMFYTDHAL